MPKPDCFNSYYTAVSEILMMPVKVRYHEASDTVYDFDAPTLSQVEEALKNGFTQDDVTFARSHLKVLRSLLEQENRCNPTTGFVEMRASLDHLERLLKVTK